MVLECATTEDGGAAARDGKNGGAATRDRKNDGARVRDDRGGGAAARPSYDAVVVKFWFLF
ncbi:TPR-like protein [Sesbania bispinosa]|nr:TPR-like protein [Sesbania bispinosa]